jgi:biotin synthase
MGISPQEAIELLALKDTEREQLIGQAERIRRERFGDRVRLCAISNAKSGACPERCDFCAQSAAFQTTAPVFPMKTAGQIAAEAERAEAAGAREFAIVTSGRTLRHHREMEEVRSAVRLINEQTRMETCASLGEVNAETLAELRETGLIRYHHNIETAPSFHHQIVHTHGYDDEVQVVEHAKAQGLAVCCGGILGMGETDAQRVEMAFALRDLAPACVPLNFLDPRPGTPLERMPRLSSGKCLQIIALFRLVLPRTHIFICGGREACLGSAQRRIFEAGATGMMVGDYLTTRGQGSDEDRRMIERAGFTIEAPSRSPPSISISRAATR